MNDIESGNLLEGSMDLWNDQVSLGPKHRSHRCQIRRINVLHDESTTLAPSPIKEDCAAMDLWYDFALEVMHDMIRLQLIFQRFCLFEDDCLGHVRQECVLILLLTPPDCGGLVERID